MTASVFSPKAYQRRAWDAWADLLARVAGGHPVETAFAAATARWRGRSVPYLAPPSLGKAPSVCCKIPTGGGKTFIAAGACGIAAASGLLGRAPARHPVMVWLVPSTEIAQQTLRSLRQPNHPCRTALVDGAGGHPGLGPVRVLDDQEALRLTPADIAGGAVLIVATIQNFRIDDQDQRAVYRANGSLMGHTAEPSLVQVLASHRPLVIVDEAHNARTDRSFDALGRLNPAAVLEITATPTQTGQARLPSNVLMVASAQELHAEGMLKLPIQLAVQASPDHCLAKAVAQQRTLARVAAARTAAGAGYLRPLLLIQAEKKQADHERLVPDVVKAKLIAEHGLVAEEIRIATGSIRELDDIDQQYPGGLTSPACPVTTIITIDALKEGWDCPSAYVLCSLRGSFSDTGAIQILVRVLRQPGATPTGHPDLDRAYAVVVNDSFADALGTLRGALVDSLGYDPDQAAVSVVAGTAIAADIPLVQPVALASAVPLIAARMDSLPEPMRAKFHQDAITGALTVTTLMTAEETGLLAACIDDAPAAAAFHQRLRHACDFAASSAAAVTLFEAQAPAERGEEFAVPNLLVARQEQLWPIDDTLLTMRDWSLSPTAALLDETAYVPGRPHFDEAEIDVDERGRVVSHLRESTDLPTLFEDRGGQGRLLGWLVQHLHADDVHSDDLKRFVLGAVHHLTVTRAFNLEQLVADQWNLRLALDAGLTRERLRARREAVQELLFAPEAQVRASPPDRHFRFLPEAYPAPELHHDTQFRKHFYRTVATMNPSEVACAVALDGHPRVITWVRNLEREPHAFRLARRPTPQGRWFYPDFVARLDDGRSLVVEYKGQHLQDGQDTKDKQAAGELWARITGGIFLLVVHEDYHAIERTLAALPPRVHPGYSQAWVELVKSAGPHDDLGEIEPVDFGLGDAHGDEWKDLS